MLLMTLMMTSMVNTTQAFHEDDPNEKCPSEKIPDHAYEKIKSNPGYGHFIRGIAHSPNC
ncbi:MAG: hypothetical protein HeimC2_01470 [Candidatus Heimdallarchaeota archaeon LC_2]|nr:MAG: hypothetical protein HeimC2_01470 [Candidatus Heimdallarchaeota archaeon LC_2]